MSGGATAIMVISIVFAYLLGAVIVGRKVHKHAAANCNRTCSGYDCRHSLLAFFGYPLWILLGPLALAYSLASEDPADRAKSKHTKELENANHELKLAKIKAEQQRVEQEQLRAAERFAFGDRELPPTV